jgi:hypothetical protein
MPLAATVCLVDLGIPRAQQPAQPSVKPAPQDATAALSQKFGWSGWKSLKIGAGGLVTGVRMSPDGTLVCRCDVYGAYIYDRTALNPGNAGGLGLWQQLITTNSMPASVVNTPLSNNGVYEIAVAPNKTAVFYICYGNLIFVSTNKGGSFVQTGFAAQAMGANSGVARNCGPHMDVDPNSPDHVIVGTNSAGFYETTNGTSSAPSTWSHIASLPHNDSNITSVVVFDSTSGTTGGLTNKCYAAVSGSGVYVRTSPTRPFSLISGSPTQTTYLYVSGNGTLYTIDSSGNLWSYNGSAWSNITPSAMSGRASSLAIDPTNPSHLLVMASNNGYFETFDAGSTWQGQIFVACNLNAADIPYLGVLYQNLLTFGRWNNITVAPFWCVIDPTNTSLMWASANQSVVNTTLPLQTSPTLQTFNDAGAGIEELVNNMVLVPPGYAPLVCSQDIGILRTTNPNQYPITQQYDPTEYLNGCWWADYASTNPAFVAAIVDFQGAEHSAYSTNGGVTWTKFASYPSSLGSRGAAGCIACSTPQIIVWVPSNNVQPAYTINGGSSWAALSPGRVPTEGRLGWHAAYFFNRCCVAADRVLAGIVYMQNAGSFGYAGTYKLDFTGGGAPAITYYANTIATDGGFGSGQLKTVPGNAGHLFWSSGSIGSGGDPASHWPHSVPFYRSINGGQTWSDVSNASFRIREVWAYGFGAAAPGMSYPAIVIYGFVSTNRGRTYSLGVWRSIDDCATWQKIGAQYPTGWCDGVRSLTGDMSNYGNYYLGFGGSGVAAGLNIL